MVSRMCYTPLMETSDSSCPDSSISGSLLPYSGYILVNPLVVSTSLFGLQCPSTIHPCTSSLITIRSIRSLDYLPPHSTTSLHTRLPPSTACGRVSSAPGAYSITSKDDTPHRLYHCREVLHFNNVLPGNCRTAELPISTIRYFTTVLNCVVFRSILLLHATLFTSNSYATFPSPLK
jgi:hypothetical protein